MIIQLFNFVRKLATCAITGTRWQIHMAIEHALHYWTVSCPGLPPSKWDMFPLPCHCLHCKSATKVYITYWMAASTPPTKTTVNVPVPNHPQLGMESWRVCIYDRQLLSMHAAHVLYIYGGCPKLLFPQRPLGPSLRQPCAFLARPHSRITFIISVVFHHYSRTCFRMLNI